MRIVLDARILLPRMTGAGRYVFELARRLPRLAPQAEIHVIMLRALRNTEFPAVVESAGAKLCFADAPVASAAQWLEVPRILQRLSPDLYHYPFVDLPLVRWPAVITVYDLNPVLHAQYFNRARWVKRPMARWLIGQAIRRCRAALAISEFTRIQLEEYFPRARGKVHTIPLGVDSLRWAQTLAVAGGISVQNGWLGRPYFLYVGVDRPHKNLPRLVQSFSMFRQKQGWTPGIGPYLWLAGVGRASKVVRVYLHDLNLTADVRCTDPLDEVSLVPTYRAATAVVYVSTSEGFGLPILEGFAAGVPVLAADTSSLPEVGGSAALYCRPDDPVGMANGLSRLWNDEKLRDALIREGLDRVKRFSWDATARATFQAYDETLKAS